MEVGEVYKTENGYFAKVVHVFKGFASIEFPVHCKLYTDKECTDRFYGGPTSWDTTGRHQFSDIKPVGKIFTQEDADYSKKYKLVLENVAV